MMCGVVGRVVWWCVWCGGACGMVRVSVGKIDLSSVYVYVNKHRNGAWCIGWL